MTSKPKKAIYAMYGSMPGQIERHLQLGKGKQEWWQRKSEAQVGKPPTAANTNVGFTGQTNIINCRGICGTQSHLPLTKNPRIRTGRQ
jgi:hypothetical protein